MNVKKTKSSKKIVLKITMSMTIAMVSSVGNYQGIMELVLRTKIGDHSVQ